MEEKGFTLARAGSGIHVAMGNSCLRFAGLDWISSPQPEDFVQSQPVNIANVPLPSLPSFIYHVLSFDTTKFIDFFNTTTEITGGQSPVPWIKLLETFIFEFHFAFRTNYV